MTSSPQRTARIAGALYLISALPAGYSVLAFQMLLVRGDPAATAGNILASEGSFRLGFVADIVGIMIFAGALPFLYELFKPVGRSIALLVAFLALIGCAIQAMDSVGDIGALLLLKGGSGLTAFTPDQSQALAVLFLNLHTLIYTLALGFFGASSTLIAYLVLRSTFLPRILGLLEAVGGLGYLTFSIVNFIVPPLAAQLYPYLPLGTALGEAPLMVWLVVKGVNVQRWEEQAAATATT